jgi:hypothetical protein
MVISISENTAHSTIERLLIFLRQEKVSFKIDALPKDSVKQKRVAELIEAIEWSNARNRGDIEPDPQSFSDFLNELEKEIEAESKLLKHAH